MARPKVRLHAPPGTDEVCYSSSFGKPLRVDNDGTVEVDEEEVAPLLEKGGFTRDPIPPVEVPDGSVRVVHLSDPAALCSHAGVEFSHEADGSIVVPVTAVEHLAAHGFIPAPEAPAAAPAKVEAPKAPEAPAKAPADPVVAKPEPAKEQPKDAPAKADEKPADAGKAAS